MIRYHTSPLSALNGFMILSFLPYIAALLDFQCIFSLLYTYRTRVISQVELTAVFLLTQQDFLHSTCSTEWWEAIKGLRQALVLCLFEWMGRRCKKGSHAQFWNVKLSPNMCTNALLCFILRFPSCKRFPSFASICEVMASSLMPALIVVNSSSGVMPYCSPEQPSSATDRHHTGWPIKAEI